MGTFVLLLLKFSERYKGLGTALLFLGVPYSLLVALVAALVGLAVVRLLAALPRFARAVLVGCVFALLTRISGPATERLVPTLYVAAVSISIGVAVAVLRRRRLAPLTRLERASWPARSSRPAPCSSSARAFSTEKAATTSRRSTRPRRRGISFPPIDAPDPSERGPLAVTELVYGAGPIAAARSTAAERS